MFEQPCVDQYGNDQCHLRRFNLGDAPSRKTIPGTKPLPLVPSGQSTRPADRPTTRPQVAVTYVPGLVGVDVTKAPLPAQNLPSIPTRPRLPDVPTSQGMPVIPNPQPDQVRTAPVVSGRIKPTVKSTPMTSEEYNAAAMSRAAYIQYSEGEEAAMKYARQNVKDGWVYDPELSTEMAVVFSRGDESAIAYRGTQDSPGFNADWEANFRNRLGLDRILKATPQEAIIAEQLKMVLAKYTGGIALTTGHSRGGAEALKTATKASVDQVITFNSASYGPENLLPVQTKVSSLRTVGRLSGDLVSASGDALSSGRVKYVQSTFGENPATGLHDLRNFEKDPYEPSKIPHIEEGVEMTDIKGPARPNVVPKTEEPTPNVRAPDRADEFGAITDLMDENERITKVTRIPTSVLSALTGTAAGFGVGYGVSKLYASLGITNPYANATLTGGTTAGLVVVGEKVATNAVAGTLSKAAFRTALGSASRAVGEGIIFAPVGVAVDQLTNLAYRDAGLNAEQAGALSGVSSAVTVGALGAATGLAMGELAFGPEMLPVVALTLLAAGISAWLGFDAGKHESDAEKKAVKGAEAQFYLSNMMASGHYSSYEEAVQQMPKELADRLDDRFEQSALNTLNGVKGEPPSYKTVEELQAERKAAVNKWNHTGHFTGHGISYGSLFGPPASVTYGYDQEIKETRYHNIATSYLSALITSRANGTQFENPLTADDEKTLNKMDPNWFLHLNTTAELVHANYLSTAQQLNDVQETMLASIAAGDAIELTDEEQELLQENPLLSQAILDRVHDAEQHKIMRDYVVHTAETLNITYQDFSDYLENVDGGMTEDQAWAEQAHTHGFLSTAEYESYRTAMAKLHLTPGWFIKEDYDTFNESDEAPVLKEVMDDQLEFATKTVLMHQKATDAGFDTIDEYLQMSDPSYEFSQNTSEIESAHVLGMDVGEYIVFLTAIRNVPKRSDGTNYDAEYMRDYFSQTYRFAKTQVDKTQYAKEESYELAMGSYVDSGGDLIHEESMSMEFFDTHADDLPTKKSLIIK